MNGQSLNAKVFSKPVVGAAGRLGMKKGRRSVPNAGLICVVGVLLWLGMRYVRRMEGQRRIETFMGRGLS